VLIASRYAAIHARPRATRFIEALAWPRELPEIAQGANRQASAWRVGLAFLGASGVSSIHVLAFSLTVWTEFVLPARALSGLTLASLTCLALNRAMTAFTPVPIDSLQTEEFMIPASDAGIRLYLRNKRPKSLAQYSAQRTLLFVHGATYPAETAFDLRLNGLSWMDFIASHGYDVYLVDVRGYGRSTRPPQMDAAPQANLPIVRAPTAIQDVGSAVEFILQRRGIDSLNLLGWSWGTTLMGWYTAQHNAKVEKLVLYAPQWIGDNRLMIDPGHPEQPLGAWRCVTREQMRERWLAKVPPDKLSGLIPDGWFDAWADATLATDPAGAALNPPQLRAPNGVVQDRREFWAAGKPQYDPADIQVPTLLVHAEWDVDLPSTMMQGYFARLVNARYRRMVEIGEGTHTILMERNRMQLFRTVQQFLDERFEPEA